MATIIGPITGIPFTKLETFGPTTCITGVIALIAGPNIFEAIPPTALPPDPRRPPALLRIFPPTVVRDFIPASANLPAAPRVTKLRNFPTILKEFLTIAQTNFIFLRIPSNIF